MNDRSFSSPPGGPGRRAQKGSDGLGTILTSIIDGIDFRRLGKGLGTLLQDLPIPSPTQADVDLNELIAAWAECPMPRGVLAQAPVKAAGVLLKAQVGWRQLDATTWELELVGWCVSSSAAHRATRRQATWDLPWEELPDAVRETVIRSGRREGALLAVGAPEAQAGGGYATPGDGSAA